MAITYTGERDIVVGVSGAFNLVFTNVVPSSGDLLVLTIGTGSGSAFTQSWSAVTGAGWTLAASSNPANESQETNAAIFYKISDGTETGINVDIGNNSPVVTATRWTGNATSSVLDATGYDNGEANAPTGTDAYSGAASSTADGAAIALVVWKDQRFAEDGTNSASNSFTIIQDIDPSNHGGVTNNANPVIAWLAYTGSASRSTTITTTDTGDENAGVIALFKAAGGGGATITGSGTPTAQSSTVAGTAERSVTGTGTPTAQASAVAGVAERVITSSGTPTAQSSTVSGTGTVGGAFTGSGTLQAQSATVSGTAERSVTGTGAPASQAATVSGTAERVVTGTGTPTSQSSTVSGTGQVGNVVTGSGSPTAQAATVSGTAERTVTSSGALSAQSSTVAGTAERTITGSGALSAQSSTVYGFDSTPVDTGVRRIYPAGGARIDREINEWFQKNEDTAHAKRLMREDEELVLILLALAA